MYRGKEGPEKDAALGRPAGKGGRKSNAKDCLSTTTVMGVRSQISRLFTAVQIKTKWEWGDATRTFGRGNPTQSDEVNLMKQQIKRYASDNGEHCIKTPSPWPPLPLAPPHPPSHQGTRRQPPPPPSFYPPALPPACVNFSLLFVGCPWLFQV